MSLTHQAIFTCLAFAAHKAMTQDAVLLQSKEVLMTGRPLSGVLLQSTPRQLMLVRIKRLAVCPCPGQALP